MKTYIFITNGIRVAGGTQCYVASKARYLESKGWKVHVFSSGFSNSKQKCLIPYLDKFIPECNVLIGSAPHKLPNFLVRLGIKQMSSFVKKSHIPSEEVIVESHEDTYVVWGEMLASVLNAKHFFITMNEEFRGPKFLYQDKIDFFKFKYFRREIFGSDAVLKRLFDGVLEIMDNDSLFPWVNEEPFQDVEYESVARIELADYNICHIGRSEKKYVQYAIEGVGVFAGNHADKKVQLLMVGDASCRRELIDNEKRSHPNLIITELGFLHPLPKDLLKKSDVVIACSGAARHSVEEGALVIVADAESGMSNGLLGYETTTSIFASSNDVNTSFSDSLERALITKVYLHMEYKFPPKKSVEDCTKQNFKLLEGSAQEREYYDTKELLKGKKDFVLSAKIMVCLCLNTVEHITKLIVKSN